MANYFSFKFNSPSGDDRIHKYMLQVSPEVPNDSVIMRKLVRRAKYELREKLAILVVYRDCLYSLVNITDLPEISIEFDGTTYKVKVQWVQQITPKDRDMLVFYKIFLNRLMERGELKRIGIGKHFDASRSRPLKGCEVWPGYATALSTFQSGVLFCVNPTNKFVME